MQEQRNAVARFLEARDMKREALEIATDADYRFDLAVSLGELGVALQLAEQSGSELKWRQLGELALSSGKLQACSPPHTLHVALIACMQIRRIFLSVRSYNRRSCRTGH